jgi:hypothetical protein
MAAAIANREVESEMSTRAAAKFSVYGMCFLHVAYLNHRIAVRNNYRETIPFFLDTGNPHKGRVVAMHELLTRIQREGTFLHVGALTFADDIDFGTLQAADVIAWLERRRVSNIPLAYGFAPLEKIAVNREVVSAEFLGQVNNLTASLVAELEKNPQHQEDD